MTPLKKKIDFSITLTCDIILKDYMNKKIALIITGILIGLLVMSQYQSIPLGPFRDQYQPDADREVIVGSLNEEREVLKNRIAELRAEIQRAQQEGGGAS